MCWLFVWPRPFQDFQNIRTPNFNCSWKNNIFRTGPIFLVFSKWSDMFKSIIKGSYGSTNPEFMQMLGFGLSHKQVEKFYKLKSKQNNYTEFSGNLFENIHQTNGPANVNNSLKLFGPILGIWSLCMKISQLAEYQWRYLQALFDHPWSTRGCWLR